MLGPNDMKGMTKVLEGVIKPGALGCVFCSALQFSFCYKAFAPEKREAETVPGKIPARTGLRARRARM